MCGIAGIVRYDRPASASRVQLGEMQRRIAHRGPDGRGEAVFAHAALAHTRLAMVDPSNGAQPMTDGRFTVVYNGELYNHDCLRARLRGPWRTRCDTETLLAAWREWGEGCVDQLDGMFALFVWDDLLEVGYAARDRLGVKPFAYVLGDAFGEPVEDRGGAIAFASEAQALLPVIGRARGHREAILEYLVAPAFSGVARSPLDGVTYLLPGHVMRVSRGGVSTRRYWRWQAASAAGPNRGPNRNPTREEAREVVSEAREMGSEAREVGSEAREVASVMSPDEVREAFDHAVSSAMRSHEALGVFVSGGLDSTAIAAAMARTSDERVPAWSIVFDGQADWHDSRLVVSDDTPFARLAAAELGLDHHEVRFDRARIIADLAEVARVNDALPAWEQELSQRALARAASKRVKAVLVGDAADETHYGYHFVLDAPDPWAVVERLGSVPVVDRDVVHRRLAAEYDALAGETGVAGITRLVVERWLPRLLHNGDVHCMAFGLEARVPFAANRLLELAQHVTPTQGADKRVLREALRGRLPEPIRVRRKSALPKDQAVGEAYRARVIEVLRDPHPIVRELVDVGALPVRAVVLDERERAVLFRVIALHDWAVAHGVV